MKQYPCFFRAVLLSCGLLGWLSNASATPAGDVAVPATDNTRPSIHVKEGRVSATIAGDSLAEILREISAQTGIELILHGSRQEKVSAQFQSVSLEEALQSLLQDNFLLISSGTDTRVVEIWVVNSHPFLTVSSSPDSLLQELQDGDVEQRRKAVWELGDVMDKKAQEGMIIALKEDADAEVRQRAAWLLEFHKDPKAVHALAEAIVEDSDESVRQRAIESMAKIGGREAIEPLNVALQEDPDPFVRYEALTNLAEIGGDDAEASLFDALNDPDELVRSKAEELLNQDLHD